MTQLQEKIRDGTLAPNDLIARDGTSDWAPAHKIPGLFAAPAVAVPAAAPAKPAVPVVARPAGPVAAKPAVPVLAKPAVSAAAKSAVHAAPAPAAVKAPESSSLASLVLVLPKPILFGLCGGFGGLFGAVLIGELVWAILSPARLRDQEPRVRLAVPDTVRIYPGARNFLVVRVAREGFSGPIAIEAVKPPPGVNIDTVQVAPDDDDPAISARCSAAASAPPSLASASA